MRTRGGCFFTMREYDKAPTDINEQILLLSNRGLIIDSEKDLAEWLECVSYYRLRGYTHPFQELDGDHRFVRPFSQTDLKNRYEYDRRLRLHLIDGIDHIEVLLRTQLGLHMATTEGPLWYENRTLFRNAGKHREDLLHIDREINRASEVFLVHFFRNYDTPNRPPSWMILEVLSFGTISKLFENLRQKQDGKKAIIRRFGFGAGGGDHLSSWLKSLVTVRNHCAHHARIIDRKIVHTPRYAPSLYGSTWHREWPDSRRVYTILTIVAVILETIPGGDEWKRRAVELLKNPTGVSSDEMGVPKKWDDEPLWKRL
jgi:abortive infection bacteriophage resistance protein